MDPDGGAGFSGIKRSGWWYEGSGIYRHARLVRTSSLQVAQDGLVARSTITRTAEGSAAAAAASATLAVSANITNAGSRAAAAGASVAFTLVERASGKVVATANSAVLQEIPAGASCDASATITVHSPKLWSARDPALYDVSAELSADGGGSGSPIDAVNITHGFRTLEFSGADGKPSCALNGQPFKWRGFWCVSLTGLTPFVPKSKWHDIIIEFVPLRLHDWFARAQRP